MAVQTRPYTVEEFDQMVMLPENADRRLEYIGGEIVEMVSNNYSSEVAARILYWISNHVIPNNLGRVTGADGGYQVADERYIPDVAFVSKARQPESSHDAYNPNAPDLAVEVLSPSDKAEDIRIKIANYLAEGTLLWVVEPESKTVEIYVTGQKGQRARVGDTLDGGDVLPGFTLAVKDVFPE